MTDTAQAGKGGEMGKEKTTIWYCVGDDDPLNGFEFVTFDKPPHDWGCIAQECAEEYYHDHDGWESSWPQDVFLRETEDGPIVASFSVHMEAEPQFYAYEKVPQ